MGFDPNEPRDKSGKWTVAASGHNAGGGNRTVADHIKKQHLSLELISHGEADHPAFKSFKINQGSRHVGNLETESFGKRVEINNVESLKGPNSLGPHIRNIARELKKHFPQAETAGGFRASGARGKRGGIVEVKIK